MALTSEVALNIIAAVFIPVIQETKSIQIFILVCTGHMKYFYYCPKFYHMALMTGGVCPLLYMLNTPGLSYP
jgi:hypothetical protein